LPFDASVANDMSTMNAGDGRGGRLLWLRALLSFLALPGVVAFAVPLVLLRADRWCGAGWAPGAALAGLGFAILLWCVRDFHAAGRGTLAPWDPPRHLVVVGLYRFVRNPMYVGVLALVAGWALLATSPLLGAYTVALALVFHLRVVSYEEPWCARTFGGEWSRYAAAVPRWVPGLTPRRW
jgi:protein-S-isoprenylcysteine O-methyltransferase Ste14